MATHTLNPTGSRSSQNLPRGISSILEYTSSFKEGEKVQMGIGIVLVGVIVVYTVHTIIFNGKQAWFQLQVGVRLRRLIFGYYSVLPAGDAIDQSLAFGGHHSFIVHTSVRARAIFRLFQSFFPQQPQYSTYLMLPVRKEAWLRNWSCRRINSHKARGFLASETG